MISWCQLSSHRIKFILFVFVIWVIVLWTVAFYWINRFNQQCNDKDVESETRSECLIRTFYISYVMVYDDGTTNIQTGENNCSIPHNHCLLCLIRSYVFEILMGSLSHNKFISLRISLALWFSHMSRNKKSVVATST